VFAQKALNGVADGALFGNPAARIQARRSRAAIVYSGVVSFDPAEADLAGAAAPRHRGRRSAGLDISAHGEERICTRWRWPLAPV
jgi:Amt family ammonium transporter